MLRCKDQRGDPIVCVVAAAAVVADYSAGRDVEPNVAKLTNEAIGANKTKFSTIPKNSRKKKKWNEIKTALFYVAFGKTQMGWQEEPITVTDYLFHAEI